MHLPWADMPVNPDDPAGLAISTSIAPAEAGELREFAQGAHVLEIGAAYGFSAITMALAGAESVTSVDPHEWIAGSYEAMLANIAAAQPATPIEIIRKPSAVALADFAEQHRRFGLVFIDGDHSESAVREDVLGTVMPPVLRSGGTLACHDYGEDCCCPGVRVMLDRLFPAGPDRLTGTLFIIESQPGQRVSVAAAQQMMMA